MSQKQLIAGEGDKHERAYLDRLLSDGVELVEIEKERISRRLRLIPSSQFDPRAPVIYQAALQAGNFAGFADFLVLDQHEPIQRSGTRNSGDPQSLTT